jgi:hypothetical protein
MIVRPGLLVAIVICVVLVGWWAASGFPMVSLACKQAHRLTLSAGHFRHFATILFFQIRVPARGSGSRDSLDFGAPCSIARIRT